MAEVQSLILEGEDNEQYTVFIEPRLTDEIEIPQASSSSEDLESYGFTDFTRVKLEDVHKTIRGYTKYAIGAFKNLGEGEVEEITLKFNLKISGKAGLPVLTESSAESSFEIQVKCKFSDKPSPKSTN